MMGTMTIQIQSKMILMIGTRCQILGTVRSFQMKGGMMKAMLQFSWEWPWALTHQLSRQKQSQMQVHRRA
eukprot:2434877-Karenia_brevis.AAC.1